MHLNYEWNKFMLILVESILYIFIFYKIALEKKKSPDFKKNVKTTDLEKDTRASYLD